MPGWSAASRVLIRVSSTDAPPVFSATSAERPRNSILFECNGAIISQQGALGGEVTMEQPHRVCVTDQRIPSRGIARLEVQCRLWKSHRLHARRFRHLR